MDKDVYQRQFFSKLATNTACDTCRHKTERPFENICLTCTHLMMTNNHEDKDPELKPCPFCGGEPVKFKDGINGYFKIKCKNCDVANKAYTEKRAIENWNYRIKEET